MTDQGEMFPPLYPPLPPFSEPTTSREAAISMIAAAPGQERRVFDTLVDGGGATCAELEVALDLPHQSCSARLNALERKGLIRKGPRRRLTPSLRSAWVYEVIA